MRRARHPSSLEPQQVRSRESLRKLLKATGEVLGQRGLEGTTIPRIARHAGLTPGAVYRRFHDKEALLEAVILGILERQDERLRTSITPEMAAQIPLDVFAAQIVGSIVTSYRANAGLLRALRQFVRGGRASPAFLRKATRLEVRTYERLLDLVLANRKDIGHPDPRGAASLGLIMVTSAVFDVVVHPAETSEAKALLPKDDEALKRELTRAFLSYLEIRTRRPA